MSSGALYRTNREALGLSIRAAAQIHNVLERTVRYWESGSADIPHGVFDELHALDRRMTDACEMMLEGWRNGDFPSPFVLFRYNDPAAYAASPLAKLVPFEAQGMMVHRIRQALERAGATVEIRYGDHAGQPKEI
jgi:hypothetical protein